MKRNKKVILVAGFITLGLLIVVVFFNQQIYSSEQKIKTFKEDYFRYNDSYREIVQVVNRLELNAPVYDVWWNYKLNEATISTIDGKAIVGVDAMTLNVLTRAMQKNMERIMVRDSLIKIEFRNGVIYSDIMYCAALTDFPLISKFSQSKHYEGETFPGRFESNWTYTLATGVLLYK